MVLTGKYHRNLDDKQRVAIPKRLRDQFDGQSLSTIYVCPGYEKSLALYSPEEFDRLGKRLTAKSKQGPEYRSYLRLFFGRTERVALDSQSRIRIPDWLVQFAGLEKDLVLLGVQDHAEIWDKAIWDQYYEENSAGFDELARNAFE